MARTSKKKWGDYKDPVQNHKEADYKRELARKEKMGFYNTGTVIYSSHKHIMSKRYADNHQKL